MEKTVAVGRPNEKQKQFLLCRKKYVAFGGARGGGKSWAVRTKAKLLALYYPGIRILILRRTLPELESNHLRFLRRELQGVAEYIAGSRQFRFPGGSTVEFGYCAADGDLDRYQGAEYDVLFIDEATQLREEWLRRLAACVRGVNAFPKRIYYTCNPGGPGHGYIRRLFIDRRYEKGENPEDYAFIPARVTDNTALLAAQPDYIRQLEALPAALRRAWLEGRWDIFQGQVFREFTDDPEHYADRRLTHVIEPFDIPRSWNVYRSYDFGYAKPFSVGWWAVDHDGVIYRILELYGCTDTPDEGVQWSPDRQFAEIRRVEETHPWLRGRTIQGVADPAIWDASRGESIYETALKYRIYFTKGDNRRIPGWMQLHYRMSFDEDGYPMLYVFRNCRAFIRTVPQLLYADAAPEDVDTRQEDHAADESRYFCMSRPIAPRRQAASELMDDPLNMLKSGR
ncbi:MAG: phage terminase large subunit [Oscillospiraceae bacterium]|nr:phage terminase large subunit [Oscillospiraceae bacterium]